MRQSVLLLSVAVALVGLTACPPTYPKCNGDEDCKEHNEVCVNGQCQECATDSNCKTGFVCQQNKCVPKPECATDTACPSGEHCKVGKCTSECAGDSECGAGKCRQNHCVMNACNSKTDCASGEDCINGICAPAPAANKCNWEPVHFGFNEATLTSDAQNQLGGLADCIKSAKKKVRLEGHADERGTEEYNLQLSNRRAAAVKKYLTDLGVPGSDLQTVGYGANRPAVSGHNEEAWAANRRVEFQH